MFTLNSAVTQQLPYMSEEALKLGVENLLYLEELGEHVSATSPEWRSLLQDETHRPSPALTRWSLFNPPSRSPISTTSVLQDRVNQLIRNYRVRGHMIARLDPLGRPRPHPPELTPEYYRFSQADLDRTVSCETLPATVPLPVKEILSRLQNTYCRFIGAEYMHINDVAIRRWLQQRMESVENRTQLPRDEQLRILTRLTAAVTFEEFIRRKFIGAKSFSLEGSESLIPLLDLAIEKAGEQGVDEIVLGMAHRGRLNVLANILGKSPRQIFREFADKDPDLHLHGGDVKYHLGHSSDWTTAQGRKIHLSLCFNPSHLEFVNPVVTGRVRAKQDRAHDVERCHCLALLIHGDAAFAGEGCIQETLNLTSLPGYGIGGTLHVVVNNQIGFTTSPDEGRSTDYATDVARMLQSPVFHVNGEDPESVAQVVRLAMDFRAQFKRDVFIDMYGYRRLGHNETDEPSFTQPVLYRTIAKRKSVREGYLEHLLTLNEITQAEADEIARRRREDLERELSASEGPNGAPDHRRGVWQGFVGGPEKNAGSPETGIALERLRELLAKQSVLPADFHPHPKIKKFLEGRHAMAEGRQPLDWSAAEALAFATLAVEGHRVRLSGQDSARGTFSQRHGVLYDAQDGDPYVPLQHLSENQAPVEIINSPLSEIAVLGFDYGYSLDTPEGLILWEGQFGDFVNAAQVIIDQFIVSAEDKWKRLSGLVLLLPHGFEGMGPEHSSARLERFLSLAAEDNIQVVYPTTPSQLFHCLRRQVLRPWRKPLVIMTPKSLLRDPVATSPLQDLATGKFQKVLAPAGAQRNAERVLLCTGKVFFELEARRTKTNRDDVAIVRVEQLYPFPGQELASVVEAHADSSFVWVQEEPVNMGAWPFMKMQWDSLQPKASPLTVVCRPESASPATGSGASHRKEQEKLLASAFAPLQPVPS